MPFTFAHPAAVLPLRRLKYLQTAPLMIGSIAPDLPYFVPTMPRRIGHWASETHSLFGSVAVCVPLGFALLVFGFLFRGPLTSLMSTRAQWLCLRSMERFRQPLLWALAPVGILLGVWTHLLWDSFTHADGWMVRRVDALSAPVSLGWYTGELCHVLQYVSSAIGLTVLAIWYRHLPSPTSEAAGPALQRPPVGLVLLLVLVLAVAIGGYQAIAHANPNATLYVLQYRVLTRIIAWFVFLYVVASALVSLNRRTALPEPLS